MSRPGPSTRSGLEAITPIVLSYNEEPNITRALESLGWARRVLLIDSGSTDQTLPIARRYENVDIRQRKFDNFENQWQFGVYDCAVDSDYVLALDADMSTPPALLSELEECVAEGFSGGIIPFTWCYDGRKLPGSVLGPQLRLFRRDAVRISQHGHKHVFEVSGRVRRFRNSLVHDDCKPVERWTGSQLSYSAQEAKRLRTDRDLRLRDRLRRTGLMPIVAGAIAYGRAGGPFGGRLALRYAWERVTYEALLAIRLCSDG